MFTNKFRCKKMATNQKDGSLGPTYGEFDPRAPGVPRTYRLITPGQDLAIAFERFKMASELFKNVLILMRI